MNSDLFNFEKMETLYRQILGLILCVILFSSCSNELIYNNIAQVNYGTSFGECIGFCKREVTIKSINATYKCYSWYPITQTITNNAEINVSTLDSIRNLNTKSFFDLPETIGCPDCADGGAEWLEIELVTGEKHKVTFEYNNEPTLLKNYISKLREVLGRNECK